MADLLTALRSELVTQAVARLPRTAGSPPPLWLAPRDGVPAPGEGAGVEIGQTMVLGAFQTGGIPYGPHVDRILRRDGVDIWIRAKSAVDAYAKEVELRAALDDKRGWVMGGTETIIESLLWRPLQQLDSGPQGFDFTISFMFERRVADAP